MKTFFKYIIAALPVTLGLALTSCDKDDQINWVDPNSNVATVVSTSIAPNSQIDYNITEITVTYDGNIALNSSVKPTLNGKEVSGFSYNTDSDGKNILNEVKIVLSLAPSTSYTLEIPERSVIAANSDHWAQAYTLSFSTEAKPAPVYNIQALTNANATAQAKALYQFLMENYGKTMLSGAMGSVAFDTQYSDMIAAENDGVYPCVVGFDYIHLASSPSNWIDYSNISGPKSVYDNGGIVTCGWHWNVPTEAPEPEIDYDELIWEGQQVMPADWSGYVVMEASLFANTSVGDQIVVVVKNVAAGAQGSFKNGSWAAIAAGLEYFEISGNYSMTVTDEILASLKESGLIIGGHDYTALKVVRQAKGNVSRVSRASDTFSANVGEFKPSNVMVEGTWENAQAVEDVEKLAGYLKLLQDAGIPVLWRPLHEAAGDYSWGAWFWWGQEGTEVTKQLWIWLHDKLTKEYGLNNLIWVWTMQTSDAGHLADVALLRNAYPGDEYVDIVGTDIYPDQVLTDQSAIFELLNEAVDGQKIVALTECGNLIDPQAAYDHQALWSFFMQWYDMDGGSFGHSNYSGDQWKSVLTSPHVTNRGVKY